MKDSMENVRHWFESDYEDYDIKAYEGSLEAMTKIAHYLIVEPHNGTKDRWMLRVTTRSAFDRWANSTAVEGFFETDIDLCDYLQRCQLRIYKGLLSYLSKEYDELVGE